MIYYLFGKDTYRLSNKLKEIKERFFSVNKTGADLVRIDAEKFSFQNFEDLLIQRSFFANKKLIIIENFFSSKIFQEPFLKKIKDINKKDDVVVIIGFNNKSKKTKEENKGKGNSVAESKIKQILLKNCESQEFEELAGVTLKNWIIKEFGKYNKKISKIALERLIGFCGKDMWRIYNEINKLSNYQKMQEIRLEDVEKMVQDSSEAEIFSTLDLLASRDKRGALLLLNKHLRAGEDPSYLLSMFNYQFRNLLFLKAVKEESIKNNNYIPPALAAKKLDIHPFVAGKLSRFLDRFSFDEVKKIYKEILKGELALKTSQEKPEDILRNLFASI